MLSESIPADNTTIAQGITSIGETPWKLFRYNRTNVFQFNGNNLGAVENRLLKAIRDDVDFYSRLISAIYSPSDAQHGNINHYVRVFSKIPKHLREKINFERCVSIKDTSLRVATLYVTATYSNETLLTQDRISALSQTSFTNHEYFTPIKLPVHRGCSVNEILDVIDFFTNSQRANFRNFNRLYGGRIFSFDSSRTQKSYQDDLGTLGLVVTSFLQATKRSQKIKKLFYSMTSEKLYRALSFGVSGTLLVNDYIDLMNFLSTQEIASNYFGYIMQSNTHVRLLSAEANRLITEAQLVDEFETLLSSWNVTVDDLSRRDMYGLITYAVVALGANETHQILTLISTTGQTISRRGMMELIRKGGIDSASPALWQITILAR